jgi:hypothetical protein
VRGWLGFLLLTNTVYAQPAPAPGSELPLGAWPNVSLEDLRGMRECTLDDPPMRVGEPIACRPPVLASPAHLSFDLAWVTGLTIDDGVRGLHGIAGDARYWLTRGLGIGARYMFAVASGPMPLPNRIGEAFATADLRLFTDEIDRDAFTLSAGYGYATRGELIGGNGAVARVALSREVGYMTGERTGMTWAWEAAFEQGLGDARLRTATLGVRAGFELGIREPLNIGTRDRDPPVRYTIDAEFRASALLGMGASIGFQLGHHLAWRTTALWTTGHDDDGEHGLLATWAALTGPRVVFNPRDDLAGYVDVQAGPAAIGAMPAARFGVLGEAEVGLAIHVFCQTRLDLGARVQTELDDGVELRTGFAILRVEHGTGLRRFRNECIEGRPVAR